MPLERVMLVEDDPDIQLIARMSLEIAGGLTIEVCGSGAKALATYQNFKPDLILLDVMMPGMDGPETLRRLRQSPDGTAIPVVFITAKAMPSELERYASIGAAGVISKPFDPLTLGSTVREIWSRVAGERATA